MILKFNIDCSIITYGMLKGNLDPHQLFYKVVIFFMTLNLHLFEYQR